MLLDAQEHESLHIGTVRAPALVCTEVTGELLVIQ
jgi:hypothetical protein